VLVRHDTIIDEQANTFWADAQTSINEQHRVLARERGYDRPIVAFENVNVLVEPGGVRDPRSKTAVLEAARSALAGMAPFDFVVAINLDPARSEGGFAETRTGFVYVGNYGPWKQPLTPGAWQQIARTVYHHEIGHHWGWPGTHDWARPCDRRRPWPEPFVAPPALFGWDDADGDGIAEIVDGSPYGRVAR
jgi:hypothetical protein